MNAWRRPSVRWWWVASLLVASGSAAASYLLARTFALLAPSPHSSLDVCTTLFSSSCDGALAGEHAWLLGVPLAGWGLVYFAALAAMLALARFVAGRFEAHALLAASTLSLAGVGVGLALTIGSIASGTPLCPMCVSVHATSLALLFTLQRAIGRPVPVQLRFVRAGWSALRRDDRSGAEATRWPLVGLGCTVLVAVVAWQWVYVESVLRRPPPARPLDRGAAIAEYAASPQHALPVSERDPHRGPLNARAQLVVFESLQCPHCQRFAAALPRLEHEFGNRLLVVFKSYPLSSRCNDRLGRDLQPDACELAWAAEAAHRQGRFWSFHDAVMAAGSRASAGAIDEIAHEVGLEPGRFDTDRRSAAVRDFVAEDVELGNQLELPGTPAIYLNGRLVRSTSAETLEILIRHELERSAGPTHVPDATSITGPRRQARTPTTDG